MTENSKPDTLLKRIQISLAILTALIGLAVGVYNLKRTYLAPKGPGDILAIVKNDKEQPITGAKAELFGSENTMVAAATTQSDGVVTRKGLDPGAYTLKIQAKGFLTQSLTIQVNPQKTSSVEIVMEAAPIVSANNPIKSALEEVGASWIKTIGKPKNESSDASSTSNPTE